MGNFCLWIMEEEDDESLLARVMQRGHEIKPSS